MREWFKNPVVTLLLGYALGCTTHGYALVETLILR